MKKLLAVLLLLTSCVKESSYQRITSFSNPASASSPASVSTSTLIVSGSLDLQTKKAKIASLGIVNYRSSYELCGTSGNNLLWPIVLPLSDSAVFPNAILTDGDSLSAEVELDTTYKKNYTINLIVKEDTITINTSTVANSWYLRKKFVFHNARRYKFLATVQ